jgi:hypothetical protein
MRFRTSARSSLVLLATGIALLALLAGQSAALASQDVVDWSEWTGIPGPEECTAESVDVAEFVQGLVAAAGTPAVNDIPLQVASIDDLPAGGPASEEETEGALTTVRELLACVNAGKFGSALSLFTPEGLVALIFGASGLDAATMTAGEIEAAISFFTPFLDAPATPAADDARAGLVEIKDVRRLPDGRILVASVGDATGTEGEAFAVLEKVGDRWLIDTAGAIGDVAMPG